MEKYIEQIKNDREIKKFKQPSMRFKPRTDFERIYDTINSANYGSVIKNGLNKQLKTLHLNEAEDFDKSFDDDIPDYKLATVKKTNNIKELKYVENMNVYNTSENTRTQSNLQKGEAEHSRNLINKNINSKKKFKRKYVDNSEARNLRKDLYNKTHFKATTEMSFFKSKKKKINKNLGVGSNSPKSTYFKTLKTNVDFDKISDYNDDEELNLQILMPKRKESKKKDKNKKINLKKVKIISMEDDFKLITKNPLIKTINMKEEEHIDENALNKLKKMSDNDSLGDPFSGNKKNVKFLKFSKKNVGMNLEKIMNGGVFATSLKSDLLDDGFKKKDEEKITIDNKTYLKSEVDLISKAVLKRCNYVHPKNKNATKFLKKGGGKLMFTGGMTVSEFLQKFKSL